MVELETALDKGRLYIPEELVTKLDKLLRQLAIGRTSTILAEQLGNRQREESREQWDAEFMKALLDTPKLVAELKAEFRSLVLITEPESHKK